MRFSIFGIPTQIQFGFWLTAVFLNFRALSSGSQQYLIVVWVAVVLVSILVHELGHAFAMLRYGLQPEITLLWRGGEAAAHGLGKLGRAQRVFVSAAGPLAGFVLGGLVYAVTLAAPSLRALPAEAASPAAWAIYMGIDYLLWVNFLWGLFNLIPVLPLDGGHILRDLLGPRRAQLTARISLAISASVALYAASEGLYIIAAVLAYASFQTYQQLAASAAPAARRAAKPEQQEDTVSAELIAQLQVAEAALNDERFDEAGTRAEMILSEQPPKAARIAALQLIGWAHLLQGRPEEAENVLKAITRDGTPDPALVGAVLRARGRAKEAREVFEAARAVGDDRKNVVGPLIQLLIDEDEVARAAAIALDIVDTLSVEDARQMGQIAFEHEAYPWASRLSEAVFDRTDEPDDAYDAARGRTLEGDMAGALTLLRRAVAAGYSDAARLWSDKALEALRASEEQGELEALLPRP
jgi:Zn-dependent protease